MKLKKLKLLLIAVILFLAYNFVQSSNPLTHFIKNENNDQILTDVVISVHDGDTIRTKNLNESIRLLYINAPEVPPAVKKANFYGYEARDFLRDQILNKQVKLKCKGKDKYNRNLCEIYPVDANTDDITQSYNYLMIANGYACPFMTDNEEIIEAGIKARNKKIGIYSENSTYKCEEFKVS